jgi:hypothetical protein
MLGPIMPALGGGDVRGPLALAFRRHQAGDSFYEATGLQGQGKRLIVKMPASRRRLKRERKIMKLKVQFDREIRFDLPVWCITQTRMQWSPGIRVSLRLGNGRPAEANCPPNRLVTASPGGR